MKIISKITDNKPRFKYFIWQVDLENFRSAQDDDLTFTRQNCKHWNFTPFKIRGKTVFLRCNKCGYIVELSQVIGIIKKDKKNGRFKIIKPKFKGGKNVSN